VSVGRSADTAAAEHWRYATVVLSLSPTAAPPSASLLLESAMRVPDTTTAFLQRKVLLLSARSRDENAQYEVAKLDIYKVFLCSEKSIPSRPLSF
jgi:hypothetical protein